MENSNKENSYIKAEARVKELKIFYNHLLGYIVFLIVWLLFSHKISRFVLHRVSNPEERFINWIDINLWLTPVIWGLILTIYGIYVFSNKFNFFRDWEQKKMEEFMNDDDMNTTNQWK